MKNNILIAEITGVHGIKGWVKLHSHAERPENLKRYKNLQDDNGRVFEITDLRPTLPVQVKFKTVDDRNAAETLKGTKLYITRAQLPKTADDEYYHEDLLGLAVHDTQNNLLGSVTAVQNFGAGDILEISNGADGFMLPFISKIVQNVNLLEKIIIVDLPAEIEVKS